MEKEGSPLGMPRPWESPPALGQEGRMGATWAEAVEQRCRAGQSPGDPPCKYCPSPTPPQFTVWSIRAAITDDHQLGIFKQNRLSHSSRGQESEVKVSAGLWSLPQALGRMLPGLFYMLASLVVLGLQLHHPNQPLPPSSQGLLFRGHLWISP